MAFLLVPFLLFFAFPANADEKEERMWEEEIIYSIMVDRFHNGNSANDRIGQEEATGFEGGDFKGITEKLDYLQEMGFTAIMLSPVFENDKNGFHGESVTDYYQTDKHFGSINELKKLVDEAHRRNMKVILEFPVDRVSPHHPWLSDPDKKNWVKTERTDKGGSHWNKNFPMVNLQNDEVRSYLMDAAKWWAEKTGIDGYSLQYLDHVPHDFIKDFTSEVKSFKNDLYIIGAVAGQMERPVLASLEAAGLDGLKDVNGNKPLRDAFFKIDVPSSELIGHWEANADEYEHPGLFPAYFDDKNTVRYTRDMVDAKQYPGSRWKLALSYLYTQPQVPVIFYGTEIAVNGGGPPDNLPLMNFWAKEDLIEYIGRMAQIRKEQPALTRGTMTLLYEKKGMLVFKREYKDDTIVVAINNTSKDQTAVIPKDDLKGGNELRGLYGTDMVRSENGEFRIIVDREMTEIYKLADRSGYNYPFIIALFAVFGSFILFMYAAWRRGKKRSIQP
jgi:glycosidase